MKHVTLLLAGAIISYQIFVPPIVGLADNGDFSKLMARYNLGATEPVSGNELWYQYVFRTYKFDPVFFWNGEVFSSELAFLQLSFALNRVLSKDRMFDIRVIGAVHAAAFLCGLWLLQPALSGLRRPLRVALSALLLLVFCDVMYVSLYNTIYMDAAAFLFLWLAAVSCVRGEKWLLAACCAAFAASKPQHLPASLMFVPLLAFAKAPRAYRMIAVAIVLLAGIYTLRSSPKGYAEQSLYSVVFLRVLPSAANLQEEMRELRLDKTYERFIGTHSYSQGVPLEVVTSLRDRLSYARLGWFYLRHPKRALRILGLGLEEAAIQRAPMGNFEKSTGMPAMSQSGAFALWSDAKQWLFKNHPWRYFGYFVAVTVLACVLAVRQRAIIPAAFTLAAVASVELAVATMADVVETARHAFIFNACVDLLLVSTLALCTIGVNRRLSAAI